MNWIESVKETDKVFRAVDRMSNDIRKKYFKYTSIYDILTLVPKETLAKALSDFERLESLKVGSIVKYFNKTYVCVDASKTDTCSLLNEDGKMFYDIEKKHLEIIGEMPLLETIKLCINQFREEKKETSDLTLNCEISNK